MPMSDVPYNRFLIKYKKEAAQPAIDLIGEKEFLGLQAEYLIFSKEDLLIIRPLFETMLGIYSEHGKYSQFLLKNMLQNLILTIYERRLHTTKNSIELSSFHEQIYEALMYIELHLSESLSLELVAEKLLYALVFTMPTTLVQPSKNTIIFLQKNSAPNPERCILYHFILPSNTSTAFSTWLSIPSSSASS